MERMDNNQRSLSNSLNVNVEGDLQGENARENKIHWKDKTV